MNIKCAVPALVEVWYGCKLTHHHNNNNLFNKPTWNTYNINTLFTSSCSVHFSNLCGIVAAARLWRSRLFTSGRFQGCDQRVSSKESVSGTGSSFKGRKGKTGLTWNQNLEPSPCVWVWGSPRHNHYPQNNGHASVNSRKHFTSNA